MDFNNLFSDLDDDEIMSVPDSVIEVTPIKSSSTIEEDDEIIDDDVFDETSADKETLVNDEIIDDEPIIDEDVSDTEKDIIVDDIFNDVIEETVAGPSPADDIPSGVSASESITAAIEEKSPSSSVESESIIPATNETKEVSEASETTISSLDDEDLLSLFEEENDKPSLSDTTEPEPDFSALHSEHSTTQNIESEIHPKITIEQVKISHDFYAYLRRKRVEYGYDIEDVAEFAGLESTDISNIEKEVTVPSKEDALKILSVLGATDLEKESMVQTTLIEKDVETYTEPPVTTEESQNTPEFPTNDPSEIDKDNAQDVDSESLVENDKLTPASLGDKLQYLRERVGMSIDDVSYDTNIDAEDLIAYENGEDYPAESELVTLADCLGVSVKELITDSAYSPRTDATEPEYPKLDQAEVEDDLKHEEEMMISDDDGNEDDDIPGVPDMSSESQASEPETFLSVEESVSEEPAVKQPPKTKRTRKNKAVSQAQKSSQIAETTAQKKSSEGIVKFLTGVLIAVVIIFALLGAALVAYGYLNSKDPTAIETDNSNDIAKWEEPENFTEALSEYDRAALYINDEDMNLLGQYKEYNSDVYGIIRIDDSILNHPFTYTPDNESFYLNHDLDKKTNSHGVPFMVSGCRLGQKSTNTIIYGHNITVYDKDVFADIAQYENIEYYKKHPYIETITEYGSRKWLIFAYYLIDTDDDQFNYWETIEFNSQAEFNSYINKVTERNWISSSTSLDINDSYLTLSSCSNELSGSGTNRMVLMAKLLNFNEDVASSIENATQGNPILPDKLK